MCRRLVRIKKVEQYISRQYYNRSYVQRPVFAGRKSYAHRAHEAVRRNVAINVARFSRRNALSKNKALRYIAQHFVFLSHKQPSSSHKHSCDIHKDGRLINVKRNCCACCVADKELEFFIFCKKNPVKRQHVSFRRICCPVRELV